MNTETLIEHLTRGLRPVRADAGRFVLLCALAGGAAIAGAYLLFWPSLGVRPDIGPAMMTPAFWIKMLYTASIALLGSAALERLGRPEGDAHRWLRPLWLPLAGLVRSPLWVGRHLQPGRTRPS
jgi:hypothetical protein